MGPALRAEARARGADLLVMGEWSHGMLAERVFGGATRDILAGAGLPGLMRR